MATDHFHSTGAVLGTASAMVYTVPWGRQAVAIMLQASNVTAAAATVTVVRYDYDKDTETTLASGLTINPGAPQEIVGRLALRQGDEVRASSDTASAIHLTLSTAESDTGETDPTTPPVTSGLVQQLVARDLDLADGAAVSNWPDTSGFGNDVSQSDTTLQPVYEAAGLGGQPAVYFNVDRLVGPGTTVLTQPNTVFVVATQEGDTSVAERHMIDGASTTQRHVILEYMTNGVWRYYAGAGLDGSMSDNVAHVWGVIFDGLNSVARVDGLQDAAGDLGAQDLALTTLGGISGSSQIGRTAEVLVYDRRLTDAEVADVEAYLADKYGITLG